LELNQRLFEKNRRKPRLPSATNPLLIKELVFGITNASLRCKQVRDQQIGREGKEAALIWMTVGTR
jgi:hypothetical protein